MEGCHSWSQRAIELLRQCMAMLNPWWLFPHTFLSFTYLEIAFRNCHIIFTRTEVRLCDICFLTVPGELLHLKENSKEEWHCSALINHGCIYWPACACILSLICLTLVVFLSPEHIIASGVWETWEEIWEDWGKEGIKYLMFFCTSNHFFLTIPVQQWTHSVFGLPFVAAVPVKPLLPFTFLNSVKISISAPPECWSSWFHPCMLVQWVHVLFEWTVPASTCMFSLGTWAQDCPVRFE